MEKSNTAIATNGERYEIIDHETKKVKLVKTPKTFVANDTMEGLSDEQELENTKTLYKYLKEVIGHDVTMSGSGYVKYHGLKMWYSDFGFRVFDLVDKTALNINEFNNDLAYPKDVAKFLNEFTHKSREKSIVKNSEAVKIIDKLSEKFVVKNDKGTILSYEEKPREDRLKSMEAKAEETLLDRRKKRLEKAQNHLLNLAKEGAKLKALKDASKRISQKKDMAKEMSSLITQFRKGVITLRQFSARIKKLTNVLAEKETEPKVVRAERFKGLSVLYVPRNLVMDGDTMLFKQKDDLSKMESMKMPTYQYLVNQVLYKYPKAMALLTNVANGEEVDIEEINMKRFVVDPTIGYSRKTFDNTKHPEALAEVCREILWHYEEDVALDNLYSDEYAKGDKVKVHFPDYRTWYYGKVVSLENGVKVLYDDGDIQIVQKHQAVKLIGGE